jgi:hypothetical protein
MSDTPDKDPSRPVGVHVGGGRKNPHRFRNFVLRWGGAALLLAVVAIVAYKAVYPAIKVRRGRDHAQDVDRLLRRDEFKKASVQLKLALHFAPQDPEVLRTAARYCSLLRLPQGLAYHEMLLGTGQATDADRRGYVELAVVLGRVDLAARQLRALLQENPKDIGLLHLLVRQQRAARDLASATKTARLALSLRPEMPWLPSRGLTTTGKPISCAAAHASSGLVTGRPKGTGTPAACSSFLVSSLSCAMDSAIALVESISAAWIRRCLLPHPS